MSNRHTYDRSRAERLIPLLASITREIRERNGELDRLERAREADPSGWKSRLELRVRELHQELRRSEREIALLGCMLDREHPLRVLIPGGAGRFEGGFAFDGLSGALEALPATSLR